MGRQARTQEAAGCGQLGTKSAKYGWMSARFAGGGGKIAAQSASVKRHVISENKRTGDALRGVICEHELEELDTVVV